MNDIHPAATAASGHTQPTVLVADDDPVSRMLMVEVLKQAGLHAIGAADGVAALELARELRPDAVVIDLLMPRSSGVQVITAMRADRALRRVPAVVISGLDDVGSRVQALTAGANDFVVKPVAPAELVARVEAQLRIQAVLADGADHRRDAWRRSVANNGEFDVWFQPIVDMRSGHVVAQEALARFRDETCPTEAFHDKGSIDARIALELAVLERAVFDATALPAGITLHVNVSPPAAHSPRLAEIVQRADRPCVVEITENELFGTADATALRAALPLGFRIAADDVGVGYAGLVQILDVRPDIVKIDRAVVSWVDEDPARQALVAGLVQFGAATGCTLIAEGVERHEEREALLTLGVTIGQGYLFGRPAELAPAESARTCDLVGSAHDWTAPTP